MSDPKFLFGLFVETKLPDELSDHKYFGFCTSSSSSCICASYDKQKLENYAKILNDAEEIRREILPHSVFSFFFVNPLKFF